MQWKSSQTKLVVVTYYSCNPQGEQYAQYCHYQLINTIHTSCVWQQESATDEEYISAYRSFLQTIHITFHYILKTWRDHSNTTPNMKMMNLHLLTNKMMQLCQLNQQFADTQGASTSSPITDWAKFTRSLSPHTLMEAATWIRTHRETYLHITPSKHDIYSLSQF